VKHLDWLTPCNQKIDSHLTFMLDTTQKVDSFDIWNQNEYSGSNTRDVANIDIEYSTTGADYSYVKAKSHTLSDSNQARPNPKQTVAIPDSIPSAKFWRVKMKTFHSTNCHAGLMKVLINSKQDSACSAGTSINYQSVAANACYSTSRCVANLNSEQSPDFNVQHLDWLTPSNQKQGAYVTFTFASAQKLSTINLWNQNEYTLATGHSRDAKNIAVLYSNDGSTFTEATGHTLHDSNGYRATASPFQANPRQPVPIPGSTPAAKYWRVRLDSFYSTNAYSGLMKVSFDGCASNVPSSCSSSSTLPYTASASVCHSSSRCVANLQSTQSPNFNQEHLDWLTPCNQKENQYLNLMLTTTKKVTSFQIWNQNEYSGSNSRDVANIDIEYSTTGAESSYVSAKTHTLSNSNAADSNPEQTASIPSSVPAAKYWRIKLLTFHSANCHAGLMKVEVKGC